MNRIVWNKAITNKRKTTTEREVENVFLALIEEESLDIFKY
jgi:hypothetical protein